MPTQLERGSSSNLRRSKSLASVQDRKRNPCIADPIPPEQARVHALIAAHRAMDRSRGSRSDDLRRTLSTISGHSQTRMSGMNCGRSSRLELQRQRSLLRGTSAEVASDALQSSGPKTRLGDVPLHSHACLLSEFGESYGAEPSSYRKLRSAKSMLDPVRKWGQAHSFSLRSPISFHKTLRHTTSHNDLDGLGLKSRLKKSVGILRRRNPSSLYRSSIAHRPESIKLGRSSFLRSHVLPEISKKASACFNPKSRKARNEFRRTLRPVESVTSDLQPRHSPNALERARSISSSLRNRFMRALTRTTGSLPPQHLEASQAHFGAGSFHDHVDGGFDNYDGTVLEGKHIHTSSPYGAPDSGAPAQQQTTVNLVQESQENLQSTSGSRVTSWTNSTNTDSLRDTMSERKRLSVIKEDGSPYQPSCSAGTHLGGVLVSRRLLPSQQFQTPDSQQLYSALVRRINQESSDERKLQTIHDEEDEVQVEQSEMPASMIRHSHTQSSIRSIGPANEYREFSMGNPWQECSAMPPERIQENVDRRKEKLKPQEPQTSFIPDAAAYKPEIESPFKQHLNTDRDRQLSKSMEDLANEINKPRTSQSLHDRVIADPRYLLSSESFYSQITNGEGISRHELRIEAEEQLNTRSAGVLIDDHTSRLPRVTVATSRRDIRARKPSTTSMRDDPETEPSLTDLRDHTGESAITSHVREPAQVETTFGNESPDTLDATRTLMPGDSPEKNWCATNRDLSPKDGIPTHLQVLKNRSPMLDVQRVTESQHLTPCRSDSPTEGQSGVLQRITNEARPATVDGGKHTASVRKISPARFVKRLRSKASMPAVLVHRNAKENRPNTATTAGSDQPVSTPGPLYLASRKRNSADRVVLEQRSPFDPRPEADRHPAKEESPTERFKATLSARLSRPFDMDTPNLNRPFDSMYLGKREAGFSDSANGRLSTQRVTGSYGGLGPNPLDTPSKFEEATALPHFPTPNANEKVKHNGRLERSLGSKRMVSNFLKSRRKAHIEKEEREDEVGVEGCRIASSQEWTSEKLDVVPQRDSPLFV